MTRTFHDPVIHRSSARDRAGGRAGDRGAMTDVDALLIAQDGVVSRAQALQAGLQPQDVRRLVRRRELATLHPGVYLAHTGTRPGCNARWGAVLACGSPVRVRRRGARGGPCRRLGDACGRRPGRPGGEDGADRDRDPAGRAAWSHRPACGSPAPSCSTSACTGTSARPGCATRRLRSTSPSARRATSPRSGRSRGAVQGRHTTAVRMQQALASRARAPRRDLPRGGPGRRRPRDLLGARARVPHPGRAAPRLPRADRQLRAGTGRASSTATCPTANGRSSWTDGSGTTPPSSATVTSSGTSMRPSRDGAPYGSRGARWSAGRAPPRPSCRRCSSMDGWPPGRPCGPGCALARAA